MGSLRARLTLGITLVLAVVLALAGLVVATTTADTDQQVVDDRLRRTAELSRAAAVRSLEEELPDVDRRLDAVLDATGSSLRLTVAGTTLLDTGEPIPGRTDFGLGLRTAEVGGRTYRIFTEELDDPGLGGLARLQVTSSLEPLERRQDALRRQLAGLGALVLLLAAAGTWLAASRVLRPLRRLRRNTAEIASAQDLSRRVPVSGASELAALAGAFNAMLERLGRSSDERERALEATRRFAADAGHELRTPLTAVQASLSLLARHPDLDAGQRVQIAADALADQRRLVELLDGLQALARGDARTLEEEPCDLAELSDAALLAARERHPQTTFEARLPERAVVVRGWEAGLRSVLDNLLENAVRHGRHGGGTVRLELAEPGPVLAVADDGPGIPAADRERVLEPFARSARGDGEERPGSGLGLALVAQQARLHGARVVVGADEGLGGARVELRFGAARGR